MATLTPAMPRIVVMGDAEVKRVRVADNAVWNAGQFARKSTSGVLKQSVSGDDVAAGGIHYYTLSVQADPDNNTTFANVVKIANDTIFEGNLHHDTPASALAAAGVVGQQYAIDVASNVATLDMEVTNDVNAAFEVTEIGSDYNAAENSAADLYGRVRFKVLQTVLEAIPQA